jgi:hypothetical protein
MTSRLKSRKTWLRRGPEMKETFLNLDLIMFVAGNASHGDVGEDVQLTQLRRDAV